MSIINDSSDWMRAYLNVWTSGTKNMDSLMQVVSGYESTGYHVVQYESVSSEFAERKWLSVADVPCQFREDSFGYVGDAPNG